MARERDLATVDYICEYIITINMVHNVGHTNHYRPYNSYQTLEFILW